MGHRKFRESLRDLIRRQKFHTNIFCTKFFENPSRHGRPRPENRGRPHQKVGFPADPVMGRNFLTPGRPGGRVGNVRRKFGPNNLCLCCFSSLINESHGLGGEVRSCFPEGLLVRFCTPTPLLFAPPLPFFSGHALFMVGFPGELAYTAETKYV